MYKLKLTRLQNEIFRLLCIKAGEQLNQRKIAKFLRVSPTAVSKSIKKLEKENLIRITRQRKMNLLLIDLNRDNESALDQKRIENLKLIYEAGLVNFLEEQFPGTTIILFGSFSRGDDTLSSDIDIAVIEGKEKEIDLEEFEKLLERKIIINFYSSFKKIHKHLKDNILNGILLSGSVDI